MKATWAWPVVLVALSGAAGAAATRPDDPAAAKALLKEHLGAPETPKEHIQALIEALGHDDFGVREKATGELIAIGEAARPLLEQAAKSDDPEVRWRATTILQEPPGPQGAGRGHAARGRRGQIDWPVRTCCSSLASTRNGSSPPFHDHLHGPGPRAGMVTVTKTSEDDTTQTFVLPTSRTGTVYVRVLDTDPMPGNRSLDTV